MNRLISRERAVNEHGFANLKSWRVLITVRMNARHATTLLRALLVLANRSPRSRHPSRRRPGSWLTSRARSPTGMFTVPGGERVVTDRSDTQRAEGRPDEEQRERDMRIVPRTLERDAELVIVKAALDAVSGCSTTCRPSPDSGRARHRAVPCRTAPCRTPRAGRRAPAPWCGPGTPVRGWGCRGAGARRAGRGGPEAAPLCGGTARAP